jgi:hypothetical protein
MERILYQEEQRFDQGWFRLIMIGSWTLTTGLMGYGMYQQLILKKPWGDNPSSDAVLIAISAGVLVVMSAALILSFRMRLITEVTPDGFRFRFPPIIRRMRTITKGEIGSWEVRKYSAVFEYGGWGYRRSLRKGISYNTGGDMGLQLRLKSGKKILFGTRRPNVLLDAMTRLMRAENS